MCEFRAVTAFPIWAAGQLLGDFSGFAKHTSEAESGGRGEHGRTRTHWALWKEGFAGSQA